MTKVVRFHSFGGPEVLQLDAVEIGEPGPGEVRIRVGAFGLNRIEAVYRAGHFGPVSFPARIGYEAAGVIEAVGEDVIGWKAGDRVATLYGLSMEAYGTHGEAILYPADMLVPVPDGVSLTAAAAAWMQYGTAYGIVEIGGVRAGDPIVITAASSSVGIAAIQIARDHQAVPIAVTRTCDKAARLTELGAAYVIVSDEEDVAARILEITGNRGARIVFDAVGGAPLAALLPAVAPLGIVMVYGMLAGVTAEVPLPPLMMANITLRGFSAELLVRMPEMRVRMVDYVADGMARGTLKPVIDSLFGLNDITAAHRQLESNAQVGKIVVTTATASD